MSFQKSPFHAGVIQPEELAALQNVFGRITDEPWFSKDPTQQQDFGAYFVHAYLGGMRDHDALYAFCLTAAKARFDRTD
jgi:hypothetical protein